MSAAFLYIGTLRDRHGEQSEHLDFLVPGEPRDHARWAKAVEDGIVDALGRSGHLVEIIVSADRAPVLGGGCSVENAVLACVSYLRKIEEPIAMDVAS